MTTELRLKRNDSNAVALLNASGVPYGIPDVNGKPRVSSMPYLYDIAEGNITDHTTWAKIGYSTSTSSQTTLWAGGTEYVWPSAGMGMEVVSTDNTNDKAAGNGALTVRIGYLTIDGVEKSEIVTLNGTSAVPTSGTDIYRVNSFRVATVGSSGKAAGTISLRNLIDSPIYAQITAGQTRARSSFYTVPAGKTLYVTSLTFSAGYTTANKYVKFTLHGTYDDASNTVLTAGNFFMAYAEIILIDNVYTKTLDMPMRVPSGVDIKVSIIGDSGVFCSSSLRGWLETT